MGSALAPVVVLAKDSQGRRHVGAYPIARQTPGQFRQQPPSDVSTGQSGQSQGTDAGGGQATDAPEGMVLAPGSEIALSDPASYSVVPPEGAQITSIGYMGSSVFPGIGNVAAVTVAWIDSSGNQQTTTLYVAPTPGKLPGLPSSGSTASGTDGTGDAGGGGVSVAGQSTQRTMTPKRR